MAMSTQPTEDRLLVPVYAVMVILLVVVVAVGVEDVTTGSHFV